MTTVEALLETKDRIETLELELRTAKAAYEDFKYEVLQSLDHAGERKFETDDAILTVVSTKAIKVEDQKLVITWMKRNKLKVENYQRLDLVKLKPVLSNAIFTNKKTIGGVTATLEDTLRVSYKDQS